ncbi:unnamed protein product [Schistosoma curassoni]|uniref:MFS domain-containing protein n=1 Tax=Schistosoma curassoni TaxID=6186 RepID=A0A183L508_9TREM|nr:unnamed protein product [Schistosoma curassoni]
MRIIGTHNNITIIRESIGLSFIYLPAIATVGHWFQQKRPLAVGLALCGSGMGCLVGGQAIPRLVLLFTWRGTLILLAAVCFQCLVSRQFSRKITFFKKISNDCIPLMFVIIHEFPTCFLPNILLLKIDDTLKLK